jgi:hypothetical protein
MVQRNNLRPLLGLYWLCLLITAFQKASCQGEDLEKAVSKLKKGTIAFFSEFNPMCYSVDRKGEVTVSLDQQ